MNFTNDLLQKGAETAFKANFFGDHPKAEELSNIIKQHALAGVATGFVPVPGMDMAALVGVVWTMYARINSTLGIKFSENYVKSVASAIGTNLITYLPGVFVGKAVGSLLKFVPGVGTLGGLAIDATVNLGLLYTMGVIYAKSITLLARAGEFITEEKLKEAVQKVVSNKDFVRQVYQRGKTMNKN